MGEEYLGIGAVNRRMNKIFKDSDTPNRTYYGGYTSLQKMIDEFDNEYDSDDEYYYEEDGDSPIICRHIATGIAYYNRIDLLEWAIRKKNKFIYYEIFFKACTHGNLRILRKILGTLDVESREYIWNYSRDIQRSVLKQQLSMVVWTASYFFMKTILNGILMLVKVHRVMDI